MWNTAQISDLCEFQSGLWKGKKGPFTKINVIRNTNFQRDGNLSYENVAQLDVETKELVKKQLRNGDIILEKSGGGEKTPVGRVCLFEKENNRLLYSLSNFTCFIRIKDPSILHYKFLHKLLHYMYISGKTEPMQRNSTGIRNLQLKDYKNISISFPSLSEQINISKKIDYGYENINSSIAITKLKEQSLTNLKKSFLTKNLNNQGKKIKINQIANFTRGLTYSKKDEVNNSKKGVLRATNVDLKSNKLLLDNIRYIREEVVIKNEKIAKKNDILICTASGSKSHLGKVALVEKDTGFAFGGFMGVLRCNEKCKPNYLYYVMISDKFLKHLKNISDGANINNLKFSQFENFEFWLPPIELQNKLILKIDEVFKEINKIKDITEKIIKKYEILKFILLRQELKLLNK